MLCGENWARAERHFCAHPGKHASINPLIAAVDKHTRFGNVLIDRSKTDGAVTSAWFVDAAARNNICRDRDLSQFALRLASDDPLVLAEVGDNPDLEPLLTELIDAPSILRAARLLTLILNSSPEGAPEATPSSRFST